MDRRTEQLLSIRPQLSSDASYETLNNGVHFQNAVLRPVLQFQNTLFIEAFKHYIHKHKDHFYTLDTDGRLRYIENAVQKDIKFRNALKGMITGQFTVTEYMEYTRNSSALNKRMMNMVTERLKDQVQLLEPATAVSV